MQAKQSNNIQQYLPEKLVRKVCAEAFQGRPNGKTQKHTKMWKVLCSVFLRWTGLAVTAIPQAGSFY